MNKSVSMVFLGIIILSVSCNKENINPQNNTTKEITTPAPLIDFGDSTYRGYQGGLYPEGSNQRPVVHNTAGLEIARNIYPLNKNGKMDGSDGKIVWLSIGMSNTKIYSKSFLSLIERFPGKNPNLVLIDGAIGGQDINAINDFESHYWDLVYRRLLAAGKSPAQVQVIWCLEAEARPVDTSFFNYPDMLKMKYKSVMQILKTKFPNLKLCYLSDRIYAGYARTDLNPEPFAWYTGWAVKSLIADQINGDEALDYTKSKAAWLSWGPYLWANGLNARSDRLTWEPDDYGNDGTHPSQKGAEKVAKMLLHFFSTDETTIPWFLSE